MFSRGALSWLHSGLRMRRKIIHSHPQKFYKHSVGCNISLTIKQHVWVAPELKIYNNCYTYTVRCKSKLLHRVLFQLILSERALILFIGLKSRHQIRLKVLPAGFLLTVKTENEIGALNTRLTLEITLRSNPNSIRWEFIGASYL